MWCSRDESAEPPSQYCLDPAGGSGSPHTSVHLCRSVRKHTWSSRSHTNPWEINAIQSFLTSVLYFLFVGRNKKSPLISASSSASRFFLEGPRQPLIPNNGRSEVLCKTVWVTGKGVGYLYIFKVIDLIYRRAGHRLDTFTAGVTQVQKPLSSRILLWPEEVQWSISEGFQWSTQICYLQE